MFGKQESHNISQEHTYIPCVGYLRGFVAIFTLMTMFYSPMQRGLFQLVVAVHSPPFYMDREGKKLSTKEWQLFQKVIFLKSLTLRLSQPQETIKGFVHDVSCISISESVKVAPCMSLLIPHSIHIPITASKVNSMQLIKQKLQKQHKLTTCMFEYCHRIHFTEI